MLRRTAARLATLRWRLTLFYCGLLALLLLTLGLFVYNQLQNSLMDNTRGRLLDHARLFKLELAASLMPPTLTVVTPKLLPLPLKPGQNPTDGVATGPIRVQIGPSLEQERAGDLYLALLDAQGVPITTNQPLVQFGQVSIITPTLPLPVGPPGLNDLGNAPYFYETTLQRTQGSESSQVRGLVYVEPLRRLQVGSTGSAAVLSGYVMLAAPLGDIDSTLTRFRVILLGGVLAELLIAALLGLPLARLGLRPLERIAATAIRIGNGDLSQRVALPARGPLPPAAGDEVQQLAGAFNGMLDKIEAAFAAQQRSEARSKQFAADASHELRSPLTVLGGYLDVLLMGAKDDPAQAERILHAMQRENTRLGRLVVDLLFLTRIDASGPAGLHVTALPVADLIARAVDNMAMLAGERCLRAEIAPAAAGAWVRGDADRLYQVLTNLLDNSIRYTAPGGRITVTLDRAAAAPDPPGAPEWVVIAVADDGCGIDPAALPRIFDRFYRADRSRTRETGNAGLGLAIAKSIVDVHGGRIEVTSSGAGGDTRFTIRLPLLPPLPVPVSAAPAGENAQPTLRLLSGPPKPGVLD